MLEVKVTEMFLKEQKTKKQLQRILIIAREPVWFCCSSAIMKTDKLKTLVRANIHWLFIFFILIEISLYIHKYFQMQAGDSKLNTCTKICSATSAISQRMDNFLLVKQVFSLLKRKCWSIFYYKTERAISSSALGNRSCGRVYTQSQNICARGKKWKER